MGHPKLLHARKVTLMMAMINETDTLHARGLNQRQRTGTLPTAARSGVLG